MTSSPYQPPYQPPVMPAAPGGAPGAQERRTSRATLPWILVAVLAVLALVLGGLLLLRPTGADARQQGFATPEEAIEAFTQGISRGDVAEAASMWAGDNQAANLDLVALLERMGLYNPNDTSALPSDDPFFVQLGEISRAGLVSVQIYRFVVSLLLPDLEPFQTVPLGGDGPTAQGIADALDSGRLAGLRVERIDRVPDSEPFVASMQAQAEIVGADERREYVVLYEWEGAYYGGGVSVLRYGQEWQIDTLASTMAGSASGGLEPSSIGEHEDLMADLESR